MNGEIIKRGEIIATNSYAKKKKRYTSTISS